MKLKVIRQFKDKQNKNKLRPIGEIFEVSDERGQEILAHKLKLVEVIEEVKSTPETNDISELSYIELKKLAKERGINANQKKTILIELLS